MRGSLFVCYSAANSLETARDVVAYADGTNAIGQSTEFTTSRHLFYYLDIPNLLQPTVVLLCELSRRTGPVRPVAVGFIDRC